MNLSSIVGLSIVAMTVLLVFTGIVSIVRLNLYREVKSHGMLVKQYILDTAYWTRRTNLELSYVRIMKIFEAEMWVYTLQFVVFLLIKIGELNV